MNEEKNNNLEAEVTEEVVTAEVTEEIAENSVETAEVTAEEVTEVVDETAETVEAETLDEDAVEMQCDAECENKKKISKGAIAAIAAIGVAVVAIIVVLALVIVPSMKDKKAIAKYSEKYVDITGKTAGQIADNLGMEFEEFVAYYKLPKDITAAVHEYAVMNNIPVATYAEKLAGASFEELKDAYGWDDSITAETPLGEAWDKMTLAKYYGEANVEAVKTQYGLDASVTGDTLYGEVRTAIETKMKEEMEAQKAADESINNVETGEAAEEEVVAEPETEAE